ncbi:hypothetical protein GCM10010149_10610 [Nonomuraea roseoviolacea subsp. roseoviolacea]
MNKAQAARATLILVCFIPGTGVAVAIEGVLDLSWWWALPVGALIPA